MDDGLDRRAELLANSSPPDGWSRWLGDPERARLQPLLLARWEADGREGLFVPHADTFLPLAGERQGLACLEPIDDPVRRQVLWPQLQVMGLLEPTLAAARICALREWGMPSLVMLAEAVRARHAWAADPVRRAAMGDAPVHVCIDAFWGGERSEAARLDTAILASLERTLWLHEPTGERGVLAVKQGSQSVRLVWRREDGSAGLLRVEPV